MKKFIWILILFGYSFLGYSQDTAYFDQNMTLVDKANFTYFKIIEKTSDSYVVNTYYSNGNPYSIVNYKSKKLKKENGSAVYYYENATISGEGMYKNEKRNGEWNFYFKNGVRSGKVIFDKGEVFSANYWNEDKSEQKDLSKTNQIPMFIGGKQALLNFLSENIKYPENSKANNISGKVYVRFQISETGKVTNTHILISVSEELDKEALRVINLMPDWRAGIQYNRKVKVWYRLPISFSLN